MNKFRTLYRQSTLATSRLLKDGWWLLPAPARSPRAEPAAREQFDQRTQEFGLQPDFLAAPARRA